MFLTKYTISDLEISNDKTTYGSIPVNCSMPSQPDDIRIHDGITQMMNQSGVNSVWLSIVKINHTKWTWIDGTVQGMMFTNFIFTYF